MEITVTGRHLAVTPAIKEYCATKLAHIHLDFPRVLSAHFIVEVDKFRHVAELVLQMEMSETHQFLVFLNAETEKVNVLYRRKKGDFGLIEPTLV